MRVPDAAQSDEVERLLTYQGFRSGGTEEIAQVFRGFAQDLRRTLEEELRVVSGR